MLVLVVGPSGAGKDTVLGLARTMLALDGRFRFVRRVITRPADAGGEDHESVSEAVFAERPFALRWQAHGLSYGIPMDVVNDIAKGRTVVANVSRGVIAEAIARFPVRVVVITVPPEVLARRLAGRGREAPEDIARRLARDVPIPANATVEIVTNDRSPEQAARDFISIISRVAEFVPK